MCRRELKPEFTASIEGLWPLAEVLAQTDAETSVRLHPQRGAGLFEGAEPVGWWADGRYLGERPDFTRDAALHQGRYYVQEAASMFIAHTVNHVANLLGRKDLKVLDACAAPGGKTTAMADALGEDAVIVANEYSPQRASVLAENVAKWGCGNVIVTRGEAQRYGRLREEFDIVAVDAPCSGEGMMRKEAEAVEQWSPALVRECAERQREIVETLWGSLKPGGYMIYSTCTFNRAENEEIVEHLTARHGAESVAIPTKAEWGISTGIETEAYCCRFIPGRSRGEGLFMALLHKPGEWQPTVDETPKGLKPHGLAERIERSGEMAYIDNGERVEAIDARRMGLRNRIDKITKIISTGTTVGERAGKEYAPTQALALSTRLRRGVFAEVEVDAATALEYLRRQALTLAEDTPRGYILLTHNGYPLGFVKNIGRRANNLYPRSWRILSTY